MKTILPFVLLSFLIVGCSRHETTTQKEQTDISGVTNTSTPDFSSDTTIQKELTGTWHRDFGPSFQITNIIAPDGSYQSQMVGRSNIVVHTSEGTLIAKNGVLIDTTTKDSNTNVMKLQLPQVVQWQIVHIDEHQLVISSKLNPDKGALVKTYEKVE